MDIIKEIETYIMSPPENNLRIRCAQSKTSCLLKKYTTPS